MTNLLAHASQPDDAGMAAIPLEYTLSRLAEAFLAAGHISKSREYVTRPESDPFRLPRDLRQIALRNTGADFDDEAAFPSAKAALVRPCRGAVRAFLKDREHIMKRVGNYFLSDDLIRSRDGETDPQKITQIRRGNVKALFNSIDMDGSLEAWKRAQGIPSGSKPLYYRASQSRCQTGGDSAFDGGRIMLVGRPPTGDASYDSSVAEGHGR